MIGWKPTSSLATYVDVLERAEQLLAPVSELTPANRLRGLADLVDLPSSLRPCFTPVADATAGIGELDRLRSFLRDTADSIEKGDASAARAAELAIDVRNEQATVWRANEYVSGESPVLGPRTPQPYEPLTWLAYLRTELAGDRALAPPGPRALVPPKAAPVPRFDSLDHPPMEQLGLGDETAPMAVAQLRTARRLLGSRTPEEAARAERILQFGEPVPATKPRYVGGGGNLHGSLEIRTFRLDGEEMDGVVKIPNAHREAFAGRIASRLKLDPHVPTTVMRDDSTAVIELRPDDPVSFFSAAEIERHLATGYGAALLAGPEAAAQFAHFDGQLMRAFDYLIAEGDRHTGNLLGHANGRASWIDHEKIGSHLPNDPLHPFPSDLSIAGRTEQLDPEVVDHIRAVLDPSDVRRDAQLLRPEDRAIAEGVAARLESLLETGQLTWYQRTR